MDAETVQSNVEAGLEHPLVGAIVRRQVKIAGRLERLKSRQVVDLENAASQMRAASNSEVRTVIHFPFSVAHVDVFFLHHFSMPSCAVVWLPLTRTSRMSFCWIC